MESWPSPLPMIISDEEGRFRLEEETVIRLQAIDKPLTIIGIAGAFRTGKSYLMNRLVGKTTGFPLGNTVQRETRGIWLWYKDDPKDTNKGYIVMDTEGLDDPEKGDDNNDMQILTLCILLSSTFIYNVIGKLDNSVIDRLDFVTELSKYVQEKNNVNNDSGFDSIFPQFVLVCRDKILELIMDGQEVTTDEYMERVMLTATKKKSMTRKEETRNETKMKLRRYFPNRKCFFFVRPGKNDKDMLRLEELTEADLQEEFLTESEKFCSYVNDSSTVKKLDTQSVNGRTFVLLAKIFTDSMNDDAIPCIASALTLVSTAENTKLVDECSAKYEESMSTLELPMEEVEFERSNTENCKIVIDYFANKVFFDESNEYNEKLKSQLKDTYVSYVEKNWEASDKLCNRILDKLFVTVQEKLDDAIYHRPGGYKEFVKDLEDLQKEYKSVPNKGVQADVALEKFLNCQQEQQNVILKADKKLTQNEKELEKERLSQAKVGSKEKIYREKLRQIEQHVQQLILSHKEQMEALEKKFKKNLQEQERKNRELNLARDVEQKRLTEEKFNEEMENWKKQLKDKQEEDKKERQRMQDKFDEERKKYATLEHDIREMFRKNQQEGTQPSILKEAMQQSSLALASIPNPIAGAIGVLLAGASSFF